MSADPSWTDQLTDAFSRIFEQPLAERDPADVYATFFAGNFFTESGHHRDPAWLEPAALTGGRPLTDTPFTLFEDGAPLAFDAAGSVFEIDDLDGRLPAALHADLREAYFGSPRPGRGLLFGRDLGAVLARHGVDLAAADLAGTWSVAYARIPSDGTVVDALRAATGVGGGPDSLVGFDGEADEEFEPLLATIPDQRLAAHLRLSFQNGWDGTGLSFCGSVRSEELGPILGEYGCSAVGAWEDGSGQVDVSVVRLGGLADRPARQVTTNAS